MFFFWAFFCKTIMRLLNLWPMLAFCNLMISVWWNFSWFQLLNDYISSSQFARKLLVHFQQDFSHLIFHQILCSILNTLRQFHASIDYLRVYLSRKMRGLCSCLTDMQKIRANIVDFPYLPLYRYFQPISSLWWNLERILWKICFT